MVILFFVPRPFFKHFVTDNFSDSLYRIKSDLQSLNFKGLSGKYELELIDMFIHSFSDSYCCIPSEVITNKPEYQPDIKQFLQNDLDYVCPVENDEFDKGVI